MRGKFITLEGGEGAGKSTHAARLAEALRDAGIATERTREPGGAPGAEEIRSLLVEGKTGRWRPLTEALLHFAARHEHVTHKVLPTLEAGRWVVCDRFADSTMAYQGYGHGLGREAVDQLNDLVLGDLRPDLTVILDLPVEEGLHRASGRSGGEDRYERMGRGFHQRLRDGFLEIAREAPHRCAVVHSSGTADEVQAAIRTVVRERLGAEIT